MIEGSLYSFLVHNGLWNGVIYAATGVTVTGAIGWVWAKIHHFHPVALLKEHVHSQKRIADALDTTVPGGLSDVVQAVNSSKEKP